MVTSINISFYIIYACHCRFPNKNIIVPKEPGLAVLKGAVIFGHDPSAISERKCR